MKRVLLLLVALFMCGVAVSQEKEKKFTLIIQENLLPFGDDYYVYDDKTKSYALPEKEVEIANFDEEKLVEKEKIDEKKVINQTKKNEHIFI